MRWQPLEQNALNVQKHKTADYPSFYEKWLSDTTAAWMMGLGEAVEMKFSSVVVGVNCAAFMNGHHSAQRGFAATESGPEL